MPFDGTHLEEWQTTLLKAAEIVRERWMQGSAGAFGGPRCALGAIHEASGRADDKLFLAARDALLNRIAPLSIGAWNDKPSRTAEEVASVMESVALSQGRAP